MCVGRIEGIKGSQLNSFFLFLFHIFFGRKPIFSQEFFWNAFGGSEVKELIAKERVKNNFRLDLRI